jgi:integrase
VRKAIREGKDPLAERKPAEAPKAVKRRTWAQAAEEFIARRSEDVRPNTARGYPRYLQGSYFAPLHGVDLRRISVGDIAERLDLICDVGVAHARENKAGNTVTTAAKPSRSAAHQAREAACMLFDFARSREWVEANPASVTEDPLGRKDRKPRERALSHAELKFVWQAAEVLGDYGRIVRLAILLGNRREEIGGMEWAEIADGVWNLPAERTKTGNARQIPLPPAALEIIGERPQGRRFVFGAEDLGFSNWSKAKAKLDEAVFGKVAEFRLHDLRRTMRSGLDDLDVDFRVAEQMIGHEPHTVVQKTYLPGQKLAAQRRGFELWAEFVTGLVSGKLAAPAFGKAA